VPRTLGQALGFLLGFWLALFLSPLSVETARAGDPVAFAPLEDALHRRVNALRADRHLIPLRRLPELDRVARAHSADMARRRYLSHETPEGANPVDRLQRAGLTGFTLAAENAGRTSDHDPNAGIVRAWLRSTPHRRNLYAPPFNATGVGIARAADGELYYTQLYLTYPRR
jgi:uncharacterized protein YkwD